MPAEHLTPQQAAERAGVSRSTIVRALQDRELSAMRDNSGRWQIDPEQLAAWALHRAETAHGHRPNTDHADRLAALTAQMDTARQSLAERDAQIARMADAAAAQDARLADTMRDRDAWREQAQQLARRELRHQPADQPPGGWFSRLFRR